MNNNNKIEEISLELTGIRDTLFILGGQFANKDEHCRWDNNTISGMLNAIAYHIERISDDLDNINIK